VSDIGGRPDEIISRFKILKVIEDVAFTTNVIALHVVISVARSSPEYDAIQKPVVDKFIDLARVSGIKAGKILQFLNELAALIIEDMRKISNEKIQSVIRTGKDTAENITGYDYIKNEIESIVNELSATPVAEIVVSQLDDYLHRLIILQLSIDTDILRSGGRDEAMFESVADFREQLREAYDFYLTIIKPDVITIDKSVGNYFRDIAFQGNILRFHTQGEIEKISGFRVKSGGYILTDEQRAAQDQICNDEQKETLYKILEKINDFIHFALSATEDSAYKQVADKIITVRDELTTVANSFGNHGKVFRVIADEFGNLLLSVMSSIA